ncbi:unnamed protein product [Microthlaspi erraticum]|uniref:DUF4218 domain-containing protein n=1 Tax=Microthlaspi erraticum TaxID=1685480 RepID=A0A6D2HUK7_9BRAS|nr:unnamed protein product [Microthlaspi erraticum]CAA7017640.1 unnamed protein product [Microthlaspi erraticum]
MAEGYLAGECISFCLEFLESSVHLEQTLNCNEDVEADDLVLEGRPLQKATEVTLSDKERDIAHRYVLMNTAMMDPYIERHISILQIPSNSDAHSTKLRWLAYGPRHTAQSHTGFVINDHRFQIKRKTRNSGVTNEAFSMCRSTARDTRQMADIVGYYGVRRFYCLTITCFPFQSSNALGQTQGMV